MQTVIKGTNSIAEYKTVKETMEKLTDEFASRHKQAVESWAEGEPVKAWFDMDNNLCIQYESGNWWHYNERGEWFHEPKK